MVTYGQKKKWREKQEIQKMEKWTKAKKKWRTYSQNIDKWLSQPLAGHWEKLMEDDDETFSVTSEEESTSKSLIEFNDGLWEEQNRHQKLPFSDTRSVQASNIEAMFGPSQHEPNKDITYNLLDWDEDLHSSALSQRSFITFNQGQGENVQLLKEHLEEARRSHQWDCMKYQTELTNVQQQAETLNAQLQREVEQKMLLYKELEELKELLRRSQEAQSAEHQVERETVQELKEQLMEAKRSHHWDSIKYQTELMNVQQQAENLKCQFQKEVEHKTQHKEQEELQQSIKWNHETFKAELQAEREIKQILQEQLKEAKHFHQQDCIKYRNELEKLQKQTETTHRELEQQVKQKESLQREHEELKQSFKRNQESLTSMVQLESKMKQLLKEQLKEAKSSHQRDCHKYKTELMNVQQYSDYLRGQLQKEVQQRTLLDKELGELKQSVRCIQETLKAELKVEKEMNQLLQKELRDVRRSYLQDGKQRSQFQTEHEQVTEMKLEDSMKHSTKQNLFTKLVHTIRPGLRHMGQQSQFPQKELEETCKQETFESRTKQTDIQQQIAASQPELQQGIGRKAPYKKKHRTLRETSKQERLVPVYPYYPFHDDIFPEKERKTSNRVILAEELELENGQINSPVKKPLQFLLSSHEKTHEEHNRTLNQVTIAKEFQVKIGDDPLLGK